MTPPPPTVLQLVPGLVNPDVLKPPDWFPAADVVPSWRCVLIRCVLCFQAVDRGVVFELSYSAAIRDATMRRYAIANGVSLVEACRGRVGQRAAA